jgi:hypothetical protein
MSERNGRVYVSKNLKKTSVQVDLEGNVVEIEQPTNKPKSLEEFMERRRKRMGR